MSNLDAFEEWWRGNIDGPDVNYVFLKPYKGTFEACFTAACEHKQKEIGSLESAFHDRVRVIQMQLDDKNRLREKIDIVESIDCGNGIGNYIQGQ